MLVIVTKSNIHRQDDKAIKMEDFAELTGIFDYLNGLRS